MKKLYSLEGNWPYMPLYSFSKKLQKTFLTLLLLLCVGFVNAQSFVVDGLKYTVTTAPEVSVNKDGTTCPTGALTIPSLVTNPGTSIEYTVRTIEANAFEGCIGLTSVVIGDSLTSIGDEAFFVCSSLTSLTLPNSLTTIGDYAFYECSALTEVTVAWQMPLVIGPLVFFELTLSDVTLKVPEGEIATYEAAAVWTDFSPISAVHNLTETACGIFEFGDSIYSASGIYSDTLNTAENNDSISRLNLTILQIPVTNLTQSSCGSFTFADSTYTTSGNYSDTLTEMAAIVL